MGKEVVTKLVTSLLYPPCLDHTSKKFRQKCGQKQNENQKPLKRNRNLENCFKLTPPHTHMPHVVSFSTCNTIKIFLNEFIIKNFNKNNFKGIL